MHLAHVAIAMLLAAAFATGGTCLAQSDAVGTVVVKEDFESGSETPDPRQWSMKLWNVPDTWQLRDGAIAGIYDRVKLGAKGHGKSLNSRLDVHDIRVSYRVKLEEPESRLSMIINAGMPKRTGSPIWHIGRIVARLDDEAGVTIVEDMATLDRNHPDVKGRKPNSAPWLRGFPQEAWAVPGRSTKACAGLKAGQWHQFVVENIGTTWTVWVDGKQVATATLEHSDVDKESANFIAERLVIIDDIVMEKL